MYSGSTAVTVNGIDANERTMPPAAALKLRRARGQRARGYVRAWWFRAGGTCTIDRARGSCTVAVNRRCQSGYCEDTKNSKRISGY